MFLVYILVFLIFSTCEGNAFTIDKDYVLYAELYKELKKPEKFNLLETQRKIDNEIISIRILQLQDDYARINRLIQAHKRRLAHLEKQLEEFHKGLGE